MLFLISLVLVPSVLADFHITNVEYGSKGRETSSNVACPSDYWNCNCLAFGDRSADVINGSDNFFQVEAGLCGMGTLNFYLNPDHTSWDFYVDGGDGTLQGTCYPNSGEHSCPLALAQATDLLVCYSYICNP